MGWHYTVPNDTDLTRISIDFRVVREEEWSHDMFCDRFQLGRYYKIMTPEGILPEKSEEMQMLLEKFKCAEAGNLGSTLKDTGHSNVLEPTAGFAEPVGSHFRPG